MDEMGLYSTKVKSDKKVFPLQMDNEKRRQKGEARSEMCRYVFPNTKERERERSFLGNSSQYPGSSK